MSHVRKYEKRFESGPAHSPGDVYDAKGKTLLDNAHDVSIRGVEQEASVSFEMAAHKQDGVVGGLYFIKAHGSPLQYKGRLTQIDGPLGDGKTYRWWFENVNLDRTSIKRK